MLPTCAVKTTNVSVCRETNLISGLMPFLVSVEVIILFTQPVVLHKR